MAVRTLLWRGLDAPRMEIVHVESLDRARGTQIGIAYELRWNLDGAVLELAMGDGPGLLMRPPGGRSASVRSGWCQPVPHAHAQVTADRRPGAGPGPL
jgi:hypothetical protein